MLLVLIVIFAVLAIFVAGTGKTNSARDLAATARTVSNTLILARAEAVRHQTITRVVLPIEWPDDDGGPYSRMSIWRWVPSEEKFRGVSTWQKLPDNVTVEPEMPSYVSYAEYAKKDGATVKGDYLLGGEAGAPFEVEFDGREVPTRFVEFLPTGAARLPGGDLKRIILVLVEGYRDPENDYELVRMSAPHGDPTNWAQINIETLTGKVWIYRP